MDVVAQKKRVSVADKEALVLRTAPTQEKSLEQSNARASFLHVPAEQVLPLLLVLAVADADAEAATRGQQAAAYPRSAAAADQEDVPPRGRRGGDGGGGVGSRQGGGGRCGRRHQVAVRPERGDQGREGAPQGVPEGCKGGGADAPGVAGRGRRRRLGQLPAGRRLRQGLHPGVPRRLERPAVCRQRGVVCCAGEGHQIIGGVLLQGGTLRLHAGRCQKQDPRRPQRRRGLPLDLLAWFSCNVFAHLNGRPREQRLYPCQVPLSSKCH